MPSCALPVHTMVLCHCDVCSQGVSTFVNHVLILEPINGDQAFDSAGDACLQSTWTVTVLRPIALSPTNKVGVSAMFNR